MGSAETNPIHPDEREKRDLANQARMALTVEFKRSATKYSTLQLQVVKQGEATATSGIVIKLLGEITANDKEEVILHRQKSSSGFEYLVEEGSDGKTLKKVDGAAINIPIPDEPIDFNAPVLSEDAFILRRKNLQKLVIRTDMLRAYFAVASALPKNLEALLEMEQKG